MANIDYHDEESKTIDNQLIKQRPNSQSLEVVRFTQPSFNRVDFRSSVYFLNISSSHNLFYVRIMYFMKIIEDMII